MGNTQVKQNMKCFDCNEVAFITIKNLSDILKIKDPPFNLIIQMQCSNIKGHHIRELTLKDYFANRHSFRGQRIPCHKCSLYDKEMNLCYKCQEIENKDYPIMYCNKCKKLHEDENEGHLTLSVAYINSKCYEHRKDFIAFNEENEQNICEDCINDQSKNINKDKIIYFDGLKLKEEDIENYLEKIKMQLARINTIKMMNLTKQQREDTDFKDYLQNKMYFIEFEWLVVGEVVNTPNNYQVLKNIHYLLENKYNTIKSDEIFNDGDPIGITIKNIVDKKNQEKKVIITPVDINEKEKEK